MTNRPKTTYHPMLEPDRTTAWPHALSRRHAAFTPLSSAPRHRTRRLLDLAADRWTLWGTFAVSDRTLRRMAQRDPLGLSVLASLPLAGATSMDVPYYGFFTEAEKERALTRLVITQLESLDAFPRLGMRCLPLVKGLETEVIEAQLEGLSEAGAASAAFSARELLLEGQRVPIASFVHGCHRRRMEPVLLGAARQVDAAAGPASLVSYEHAVAARLGFALQPSGRRRKATEPFRSRVLGATVDPTDPAALAAHNLMTMRARHEGLASLAWYAA